MNSFKTMLVLPLLKQSESLLKRTFQRVRLKTKSTSTLVKRALSSNLLPLWTKVHRGFKMS